MPARFLSIEALYLSHNQLSSLAGIAQFTRRIAAAARDEARECRPSAGLADRVIAHIETPAQAIRAIRHTLCKIFLGVGVHLNLFFHAFVVPLA